jgi:uncharacterized phage protein (TIGR02218 family)
MKQIDPEFQAWLAAGETTLARCWGVVRNDGTFIGFTDHDLDLTFNGQSFLAESGITPSRLKVSLGTSVNTAEAKGILKAGLAFSSEFLTEQDLAAGLYDNAGVTLWLVDFTNTARRVLLARGYIGRVKRNEIMFEAEFRSLSSALQMETGERFARTCSASLGDSRCKVNLEPLRRSATVTVVEASDQFQHSGFSPDDAGRYSGGTITFTSGLLNGSFFEIAASDSGRIALWEDPHQNIAVGDTFTVDPGCDKSATTCRDKFSNLVNFRGFNLMPGTDAITRYAKRDASQQGESLFNET